MSINQKQSPIVVQRLLRWTKLLRICRFSDGTSGPLVFPDSSPAPQHRPAMAKFVVDHGFNVVEGGMDVLDVCRGHGLMPVMLG